MIWMATQEITLEKSCTPILVRGISQNVAVRMCHFQTSEYGIGVNLQVVWNLLYLCGMGDNPTIFLSERRCFIPPPRENAQQRKTQWRQQSDLPWSFYVPAEGSALVNLKHRYNEGPVYRLMIHSPNQNIQLLEPMKMISIARLYLVSFSTDCWLLLAIQARYIHEYHVSPLWSPGNSLHPWNALTC